MSNPPPLRMKGLGSDMESVLKGSVYSIEGNYRLPAHLAGQPESIGSQRLPPKDFICPISLDIMTHPVTLVETGQSFDRGSLERWFQTGALTCPLTGVLLNSKELRPNAALQQGIVEWHATGTHRKAVSLPSLATAGRKPDVPPLDISQLKARRAEKPAAKIGSARINARLLALWRLLACFGPHSPSMRAVQGI